jgi:hypothetical protein
VAGHPQENSWQQGHGYSQGEPSEPGEPDYGPVYEQPGAHDQQQGADETVHDRPVSYDQTAEPQYDQQVQYDRAQYDQQGQYRKQGQYRQQGQQVDYGQRERERARQRPGWEKLQLPKQQAGRPGKSASASTGFVASLFDFGFTSFVTPRIIKALYALITAWTLLWAIYLLFIGNHLGHIAGLLFVLIIVDPILILLSLGLVRVVLEFFMVTFRMQEDLKALREQAAGTAGKTGNAEDSDASSPGKA